MVPWCIVNLSLFLDVRFCGKWTQIKPTGHVTGHDFPRSDSKKKLNFNPPTEII